MAVALTVKSKFGFQLQKLVDDISVPGEVISGGDLAPTWLPIVNDLSFVRSTNPEIIELADRCNFDRLMHSRGKWWSGSVSTLLCPGAAANLVYWIISRDAYSQGRWATVWIVDGYGYVRTARDVKVARASFEFSARAAVGVTLELVGINDGTIFTPTDYTAKVLTPPYIFTDAVVNHSPSGGTDEGIHCKSVSISVDNMLDDPSEGLRLNGSYFPVTLYNTRHWRVTGSIERDYQTLSTYNAFVAQSEDSAIPTHDWNESTYDGVLGIEIQRGAGRIEIGLPNIRYTDWALSISGSRAGTQNEIAQFIALTDAAASNTPLTITPTGG